jgi:hypothetical protein
MMNRKLKQVAARVTRASKSLFQGSSSSSSRREAMLRCAHGEKEKQQHGEEEEEEEEEEEDELERLPRARRSHMVAPPIVPAREEDRVLIMSVGDR